MTDILRQRSGGLVFIVIVALMVLAGVSLDRYDPLHTADPVQADLALIGAQFEVRFALMLSMDDNVELWVNDIHNSFAHGIAVASVRTGDVIRLAVTEPSSHIIRVIKTDAGVIVPQLGSEYVVTERSPAIIRIETIWP